MNIEVRTDLALETRESFEGTNTEVKGVVLEEERSLNGAVKVTKVIIKTDEGAESMKKPKGNYFTLESSLFIDGNMEDAHDLAEVLAEYIKQLVPSNTSKKVLIAGLGNMDATPDALGPATIERIEVTRNFHDIYGQDGWQISCIAPGVMAKTGMESMEVIRGIVNETHPDVIVAIDSLAARNARRLNTTIQLTDTGINPGSGVGNHRAGITRETVGVPVIAIGVPTVIDVATIVRDIMDNLMTIFSINDEYKNLTDSEQYQFINEISSPEIGTLYVTPKDIDENIKFLGYIISEALNNVWTKSQN